MDTITHLTMTELEAGLPHIEAAPKMEGALEMIVRRPAEDEREVLAEGRLDLAEGLVGDDWKNRPSTWIDGANYPHPDAQLNIMNARAADLLAQSRDRWALAGDQLYVDFDLSEANTPAGTQLAIGETIIEVTAKPHNGCKKFALRYGPDATKFVNSKAGKLLHLRGVCAKVVKAGVVRQGDSVRKVE